MFYIANCGLFKTQGISHEPVYCKERSKDLRKLEIAKKQNN